MIMENDVYKYLDNGEERIRIINVDRNKERAFYVSLDIKLCTIKSEDLNKFEEEIGNNILIKISDPYLRKVDENKISEIEKEKRDFYYVAIAEVWNKRKSEFLDKKTRTEVIEEISKVSNIPIITVKRILCRFWQRGMAINSLLPDYKNSGARGKTRKLEKVKVGRPKKAGYYGEIIKGINITEDIKRQFQLAISKYYRNRKMSLTETYNYILRDFFSDPIVQNGEKSFIVWDKSRIPTYDQFYYWFKKFENPKKDLIFRGSETEFNLKYRELLSNSTVETDGPGARFQVDATIADVYLVSSLDTNKVIGRPVVYAIIDVFSRMVTGIYVGLEGPSWLGAMMALDNMVADKVEFCKKYEISITEEQWPANHIPDILIADGGEFEGFSPKNLINNLNIKVENTSPYRGDLKGIVERSFRTTNEKIKHKTPGAIQKEFRKRGDRDYRLDAKLTLEEFTKIYIDLVIYHNNKIIVNYPVAKEMPRDEVLPIPVQLWKWGIENKKGNLRTVDRQLLRLNVLPTGKARISRAGIKFKGLYYGSQKALEEQWFIKPKIRSIEVLYDPRNMNNIYILQEDGRSFETCYLLEASKQYKDCILEEILFNFEIIEQLKEIEKDEQNQLNINLEDEIDKIVKTAIKKREKEADYSLSSNKKIKGIKNNRTFEKELNREKEAFKFEEENNDNKAAEIIELPTKNEIEEETSGKDRIMEMLRRKRDEKREK